ncbi:F0F1 ATP synthase subunit epsilon [Entomoplasma ellychniae]|uniref:F0F1 ATP synthase subunit epsilon n=2 Tax=Entomoplasmataceae TaxID=33925 RepID=A0A2S5RGV7_9MOLU|nr:MULTISPECIES: hypothetical protein [Entomoplasmataceae]PPE04892.1 F0F1 ATP synthase subunit epsilon [Entomoplasma ellychniae]PPE06569.1 F0F1 ATP synthase subunit epsilon [Mesoplasma corruscae]
MLIKLIVNTPNGKFIDNEEVEIINLKTTDGEIGVLANMEPMISALKIGNMNYKKNGKIRYIHLHRGLAIIQKDECKIITERLYEVNEKGDRI